MDAIVPSLFGTDVVTMAGVAEGHHILWFCHRYARTSRLRVDGSRPRGHDWDLMTETRQHLESPLPGFPWQSVGWKVIQDVMRAGGVSAQDLQSDADLAGCVVGAALIGRPSPYRGPLHLLSYEERFLHEFYCGVDGSFSPVLESVALQEPLRGAHYSAEFSPHCSVFRLTRSCVEMLLGQVVVGGRTVQEIVESWVGRHAMSVHNLDSCMQLWAPLAWAMSHQHWHTMFFPNGHRVETASSMQAFLVAGGHTTTKVHAVPAGSAEPAPMSSGRLREVAEHLRQLGACAFDGASVADGALVRDAVVDDIAWLEAHAGLLDGISRAGLVGFGRFGSQARYRILSLIHIFIMSRSLKNYGDLRSVLAASIRVLLPPSVAKVFLEQLAEKRLPSPGVMSRFALTLDCGWMLITRAWLCNHFANGSESPAVHAMIDSSPQGGVDYVNTVLYIVPGASKVPWLQAYRGLVRSCQRQRNEQGDSDAEDLGTDTEFMETLRDSMIEHHCAPVGLGAQHGSTLHKAHCLYHQLWLEVGQVCVLGNLCASFASITGDLGVESGVPSLQPRAFSDMFPYLCQAAIDADDGLGGGGADAEDVMLSVGQSLYIPGGMHIISNATKDVLLAAANFDEIHTGIRSITSFLGDKLCRNLFCATCLIGPAEPLRVLYDTFEETLVGWRWEAMWDCIQKLVSLEDSLRTCWAKERIAGGREPRERAGPEEAGGVGIGAHLEAADIAVKSPFFWSYLRMLSVVGGVIEHMFAWLESCPCHGHSQLGSQPWATARRRFAREFGDEQTRHCPLRSRRAPELAAGRMSELVTELMGVSIGQILLRVGRDLSPPDRARILHDFDSIKHALVFIVQVKFSTWQRLPHLLAGVGHWDDEVARTVATRALGAPLLR